VTSLFAPLIPPSVRAVLLLLGATALSLPAVAQQNAGDSDGSKTIVIPKLEGRPRIDGMLDEALWSQALLVEDFHQYEPFEYAEPSQKTQVRIFYTEEALYIASFFEEPDMSLVSANILRQGQSLQSDDIIAVILDPYLDRRNGYRFEVNANGVRWEGLFQNITDVEGNWDGIWQANASRAENGCIPRCGFRSRRSRSIRIRMPGASTSGARSAATTKALPGYRATGRSIQVWPARSPA